MTEKQESLAVFSLSDNRPDPGYIQLKFKIKGTLDKPLFERCWQMVLELHQSMRLTVQSPINQPSMIVALKACEINIIWRELQASTKAAQERIIDDIIASNLTEGFDLSSAPAHKLIVLDTGSDELEVLWSCHHLFLDGWSAIIILNDLAHIYAANARADDLPAIARSGYGDYLRWLKSRSDIDGEHYWKQELRKFSTPTYLFQQTLDADRLNPSNSRANSRPKRFFKHTQMAQLSHSVEYNQLLVQLKITPATLIYGGWSLLLASACQTTRVMFGSTSSGRAHGLPDGNIMTGYFASLLPVHLTPLESPENSSQQYFKNSPDSVETLGDYLKRVQKQVFKSYGQEHWPLSKVQSWSEIQSPQELFDHLVLVENLPQDDIALGASSDSPVMGEFSGGLTSMYPFTLTVSPSEQWRFRYIVDERANRADVMKLIDQFAMLLGFIANHLDSPVTSALSSIEDVGQISLDPLQIDSHRNELQQIGTAQDYSLSTDVRSIGINDNASEKRACRSTTEIKLLGLWEELLSTDNISADDDFLSLGGRSILVVKMLSTIEREFDKKISLLEFIKQPTIAHLALLIDGETPVAAALSNNKSLIPFRVSGSATPVVFVHAVGTHALFLRSIVKYFDSSHPVFGLQLIGLDGLDEPLESIDDIADHYIDELLPRLNGKSVHLISHCLGSVVAFSMMKKLETLGIDVKAFIVIDAKPPQTSKRESYAEKVKNIATANSRNSLLAFYIFVQRLVRHLGYRLGKVWSAFRHRYVLKYGASFAKNRVYMEQVHAAVARGYWAHFTTAYSHDITLVSSQQDQKPIHLEWSRLTEAFSVHELPVRHMTLFLEPEVAILGERLQQLITENEAAQAEELTLETRKQRVS